MKKAQERKNKITSILLVDDNASLNMVNIRYIKRLGIAEKVAEVRNGKEALDFILQNNQVESPDSSVFAPDVIILDLNMPVMDGFEFLEAYHNLDHFLQTSQIIILSSSNRQEEINTALKYKGVKGYWVKPIKTEKWLELADN